MKPRSAFITGIGGQDGSYLSELLLEKGYDVAGLVSGRTTPTVDSRVRITTGDVGDETLLRELLLRERPDEIYNLASVASVAKPLEHIPELVRSTALPPLSILELIRTELPAARFFQASSAEMFGIPKETPQHEGTMLAPHNPYGIAKEFAHRLIDTYRREFKVFAVSGILFNHESPRRGEQFVTRRITLGLARVKRGLASSLAVGTLDAVRDWGYAKEYVDAMWRTLQQDTPRDYVIATGETHSVREVIETAAEALGMTFHWEGKGDEEVGKDGEGNTIITIDPALVRPPEAVRRVGDAARARRELSWEPRTSFKELIGMMAREDYNRLT